MRGARLRRFVAAGATPGQLQRRLMPRAIERAPPCQRKVSGSPGWKRPVIVHEATVARVAARQCKHHGDTILEALRVALEWMLERVRDV